MQVCVVVSLLFVSVLGQPGCRDEYGTPHREGEEVTRSRDWLRCYSGKLSLVGCVTDEGRKLPLGQTVDHKGYVLSCKQVSPLSSHLEPTSCIHEGQYLRNGETVRTKYYVYTCRDTGGNGLGMDITACIDKRGREIRPGQTLARGDYQYQCSLARGYVSLDPVGCLNEGVEHPAGTQFNGGSFVFICEKTGSTIHKRPIGCLDRRGQRVEPGRTYYKNGYMMRCEEKYRRVRSRVVGCLEDMSDGRVREHRVGTEWTEGDAPFQYSVYCTTCTDGVTIMKSLTKCKYGSASASVHRWAPAPTQQGVDIDPGCMARTPRDELACCGTTSNGRLTLHMDQYSPQNIEKWRKKGFRMC